MMEQVLVHEQTMYAEVVSHLRDSGNDTALNTVSRWETIGPFPEVYGVGIRRLGYDEKDLVTYGAYNCMVWQVNGDILGHFPLTKDLWIFAPAYAVREADSIIDWYGWNALDTRLSDAIMEVRRAVEEGRNGVSKVQSISVWPGRDWERTSFGELQRDLIRLYPNARGKIQIFEPGVCIVCLSRLPGGRIVSFAYDIEKGRAPKLIH